MSDTVPEHPLVREYLEALDAACAGLPAARARELHDQIAGHLEDALPPGHSDEEARAELARLGTPRSLAAEAAGPTGLSVARRVRYSLGRVRWWAWTAIVIVIAALITGAVFLDSMESATPLTSSGSGWLYPVDMNRAVATTAGLVSQTTVPVRSGQRQGVDLNVANSSDWTQVIVGIDPHWFAFAFKNVQVTVESGPYLNQGGNNPVSHPKAPISFVSPGTIPPYSIRFVHVTWTSNFCIFDDGQTSFSDIPLLVRVGLITKIEDVQLSQTFALNGPSHAPCGLGGLCGLKCSQGLRWRFPHRPAPGPPRPSCRGESHQPRALAL
jgi:hypothetical protein